MYITSKQNVKEKEGLVSKKECNFQVGSQSRVNKHLHAKHDKDTIYCNLSDYESGNDPNGRKHKQSKHEGLQLPNLKSEKWNKKKFANFVDIVILEQKHKQNWASTQRHNMTML